MNITLKDIGLFLIFVPAFLIASLIIFQCLWDCIELDLKILKDLDDPIPLIEDIIGITVCLMMVVGAIIIVISK